MKTTNFKRNNNKVKLISSLCMLLIASLMVVGSGYAWIVISTAPEVADIPVIVGANGALEIKLNIEEDSIDRNSIFRNIVEFGQNTYGLDEITLLPSILNSSFANGYIQIPEYGYDGLPVDGQSTSALVGTQVIGGDFLPNDENGVRVLGTSSGVSERMKMFDNAVKAARSAISSAKSHAQTSLKNDRFQTIVIKMVTDSSASYVTADVEALGSMISGLQASVGRLEEAYKQIIFAVAASDNGQDDIVSSLVQYGWGSGDLTLEAIAASGKISIGEYSVDVDEELLTGIRALQTTKANVGAAKSAYDELVRDDDAFEASEITPILNKLVDKSKILVNGSDPASVDFADVLANGATVTMLPGAGVYVEIADQVGNYSVAISNTVTMATQTAVTNPYLTHALSAVEGIGAPGADLSTIPMENFYGYIIDLCFKTNAESSNLLLQTDAIDRVDENNSSAETMGGGSFMTFNITEGADITTEQVMQIMRCFNIVFFDTDTNAILGEAYLKVDEADVGADGSVTAKIHMVGDNIITSLPQYDVRNVSVLVSLDAEQLANEHVSATTATSVTGILNLQFASDAELGPMPHEK